MGTQRSPGRRLSIGALCFAAGAAFSGLAAAQEAAQRPVSSDVPSISIRHSSDGLRLSMDARLVGSRTLLEALAREAGFEVVNLAKVPDEPVQLAFADEPVELAVVRLLGVARVDYIVRFAPARGAPSLVLVSALAPYEARADRGAPGAPLTAGAVVQEEEPAETFADFPAPPPVDLPDLPGTADEFPTVPGAFTVTAEVTPLDIKPEVVEFDVDAGWQELEGGGPLEMPLPPEMSAPVVVPVAAPPPAGTPPPIPTAIVMPGAQPSGPAAAPPGATTVPVSAPAPVPPNATPPPGAAPPSL
jgi:hypothetical protein